MHGVCQSEQKMKLKWPYYFLLDSKAKNFTVCSRSISAFTFCIQYLFFVKILNVKHVYLYEISFTNIKLVFKD